MSEGFASTIRRATIDLNQAGEYEHDYKYVFATKNIEAVIHSLTQLITSIKEKTNK
jgi:hypothetical protein